MSERPDSSWSAEKMAAYMKEKYGQQPRFTHVRTGKPLSTDELVKLFDKREPK